jgi:non-specific serine/threonine protein kinase/serine/threonine-protein kinase
VDYGFHRALGLEGDERRRFLEELARNDPRAAEEVQSLIAAHEAAGDFLEEPPAITMPISVGPGDRLGAYRVISEIGHGGMGVVYRATRDDGDFQRDVAIKVIDPGMHSEGILKRFRAERQILAMLDHPNIVGLLDGGSAPDGSPYLVMEYVTGTSLLEHCDQRRLGIDARLDLFLAVCDAVQFAHQRLVVHRDLKSDNILVTEDGSPRLLDFGIAKLLAPEGEATPVTLTAPMNRMLTPDYASPEQIRGEPAAVSSDVYSLGVILYELLAGVRPLQFQTRSPEEVLRVVLQVEPVPPSQAVTRATTGETAVRRGESTTARLRRRLSGDLDYVVLRALEKDPKRRYSSVDQFAADIRRYREGFPVLARGASFSYRMSRLARRHRAAILAGSMVALALIAGLIGTAWQAGVASRQRDLAQQRFNDVRALAHAVVFDIHDAIANLPGSTPARETLVRHALQYLDRLSGEAGQDLGLQRELATAYGKIGDVQGRPMFPNLGHTDEARASYEKSLALFRKVSEAWPDSVYVASDLVVTLQRLADVLRVTGHPGEAMTLMLESKTRIQAEMKRHPEEALLQVNLGVARDRLFDMKLATGDTSGALNELREGVGDTQQLFDANPQDPVARRATMISLAKIGGVHAARGARDSALACYLRAEELCLEAVAALPNDTNALRDLSILYGMHGFYLSDEGELDSALVVYGRGMAISEEMAAKDPDNALTLSDVAQGHQEIGTMLMKGGRYVPAEQRFAEAHRRFSRLSAADSGNVEMRGYVALSARSAAEACEALAKGSTRASEREGCRRRAIDWYAKSLGVYRGLAAAGALSEGDAAAPKEIEAKLAMLRRTG